MIINESEIYPYETSDPANMDCLVIAPHPDDESVGCGGNIIRHVKRGSSVTVVFLTSGDKGDFQGVFGNDYQKIRRKSALEALSILGVKDYKFWNFEDRGLYKSRDEIHKMIMELVSRYKPQLIYVPSPYEAHPDHRVAALIGWQIYNETTINVAFYEILMPLYPNILIDISEEYKVKESAIKCYKTELFYNNYIYKIEGLNRFRTATLSSDIKHAEAFVLFNEKYKDGISCGLLKNLITTHKIPSSQLEIRLYRPGDEIGITKLFREIFGREMSLKEWKWKYLRRGNKKVYSSVAIDSTYGIVAHYGGIPHRMSYQCRNVYGLAIGDVMVHPKFRGFKLFKKIAAMVPEEAVKDGFILGYGFPNERAMRLPEKLGLYEKIEDIIEANKEVKLHNNLVRYNFKLFPLDYSDIRIDNLWELCKPNLQLAVVRDREYLTWRYKNHPLFSYELWGLKKRLGRQLHGLVVLKKEEHQVLIMDFLSEKGMFKPLIKKLENYVFTTGRKTMTLWAPPFMEETLIQNGFSIKPAGISIPRTTHEKTLTKDQIKGQFFYTLGDTDFQ